jgi:hypothetical protein
MDPETQSTLGLLLYAFVTFIGIRHWRRVPYGNGVGSFIWITHRGPLLCQAPGLMVVIARRCCQCQIPYPGCQWTSAFLAVASAMLWITALSEVWMHYWRSSVVLPSGGKRKTESNLGGRFDVLV